MADQVLCAQGLYEFIPHLRKFHNSCGVQHMILPQRLLIRPKVLKDITLNQMKYGNKIISTINKTHCPCQVPKYLHKTDKIYAV